MEGTTLERGLDALKIDDADSTPTSVAKPVDAPVEDENPWRDSSPPLQPNRLKTPDPSTLDENIHGLESKSDDEDIITRRVSADKEREILAEFDPVLTGGQAGDVWADSVRDKEKEPLPPTPQSSSPTAPTSELPSSSSQPPQTSIPSTSSSSSPFTNIAALARTFSLPKHKRIISVDAAAAVPSPRTLSGFAEQQTTPPVPPPTSSLRHEAEVENRTEEAEEAFRSEEGNSGNEAHAQSSGDPSFDFQNFLDQMKTRSAEPVSKYLKSFLTNFSKRMFTVADQIKIINDFMVFIAKQMRDVDVWRDASDAEFDNAMEGMEKLVMNQLYQYTFTPAIAQTTRRGSITADDLERDRVLSQRIMLFRWIEPRHLDLPSGGGNAEGFLAFAQQELLKVNSYKAPRDKLICILNCCKVIFGLIRHLQSVSPPSTTSPPSSASSPKPPPEMVTAGADEFLPFLIYVVVKCNPPHLLSNINFITRFRSPDRMGGEGMYYLSSLEAAVGWIESLSDWSEGSKSGLTVSKEEFEKNVEKAIRDMEESSPLLTSNTATTSTSATPSRSTTPNPSLSRPFTPDALSLPAVERLLQKTGSAIGRMFNEVVDGVDGAFDPRPAPPQVNNATRPPSTTTGRTTGTGLRENAQVGGSRPHSVGVLQTPSNTVPPAGYQTPYQPRVRRVSPSPSFETPSRSYNQPDPEFGSATPSSRQPYLNPQPNFAQQVHPGQPVSPFHPPPPPAEQSLDLAEEETAAKMDTLLQIFPGMDREIVEMVLDANGGNVERSLEGLLEMSVGA